MLSSVIADNRGKWFADEDRGEQPIDEEPDPQWTASFELERDLALNDKEVLIDWVDNNVVWADVVADATLCPIPDPDDFTEEDRAKAFDESTIDGIEWD